MLPKNKLETISLKTLKNLELDKLKKKTLCNDKNLLNNLEKLGILNNFFKYFKYFKLLNINN